MANIDNRDETAPPKPGGIIATVLWTLLTLSVGGRRWKHMNLTNELRGYQSVLFPFDVL
jgi:hypothetical protein